MSRYEELIPSYIEQKARGLKPRGRCAEQGCGRELALRADNTVSPHSYPNRQGHPTAAACFGGGERSANLTLDRVRPDLDTVETRLLLKIAKLAMNNSAISLIFDADQKAALKSALAKLEDPASRKTLTRTEEELMLQRLADKERS
ncbi:hypothetical protein [Streptomyces sp. NPDC088752]|uniref:hypothetical protein n=1 Tax=Streptomyces sp. NPDC088752 TaxID=3154963 RepID=UPI003417BBC3